MGAAKKLEVVPGNEQKAQEKKEQEARAFLDVLDKINQGRSVEELSDALREVVLAVRQTGKVGELTYKVKIAPAGKNAGDQMTITDNIGKKLPKKDRYESIFFATKAGKLQREDPRQGQLDYEKE